MSYVYWYYNRRYSETGGIFKTLEEAIEYIDEEGLILISNITNDEDFKKTGEFDDFTCRLQKVSFYGDIDKLPNCLYILRHPNGIYVDEKEAYKIGVNYVINENSKFIWSKNNDWKNQTRTLCDEKWLKLVSGGDKIKWKKVWKARIEENEWSCENHIETVYSDKIFP